MITWTLLTLGACAVLASYVVVLSGKLKGPLLRVLEAYGPTPPIYYPYPWMAVWSAVFFLGLAKLTVQWNPITTGAAVLAIMMGTSAWWLFYYRDHFAPYAARRLPIPRWYHDLAQVTTRYEQRRIAYLWLRLPLRTRLVYDVSDHYFFLWADLIIMGTLAECEQAEVSESAE